MSNAYFTIARPENDAFRGYLPGSKERAELKEELARQSAEVVKIPLIIGGKEIFTKKTIKVTMPHDHAHVIAECSMAGAKELKMAVDAALAAKKAWEEMPWEHRSAIFLKAADMITGPYRKVLNASTMLGQSKTVFQAEISRTSCASASGPHRRSSKISPAPSPASGTGRITAHSTASSARSRRSTSPPLAATFLWRRPSSATSRSGSLPARQCSPTTIS